MATYKELHSLIGAATTEDLRQKITVAIAIKANAIAKNGASDAAAKSWAVSALANPGAWLPTLLAYILGEYNAQTVGVITGASDAQVQTAVDAAVNTLLGV